MWRCHCKFLFYSILFYSNNETVSRQMLWAGNIAKTMTSNGKQFTVAREMLTAVARDQSMQLNVARYCRRNLSACFKICFCFVSLDYISRHYSLMMLSNATYGVTLFNNVLDGPWWKGVSPCHLLGHPLILQVPCDFSSHWGSKQRLVAVVIQRGKSS